VHQAACFGDMPLSTAKVIFEAHMELMRRAEHARTEREPVRDPAQALPSWLPGTGGVAPEVVRTAQANWRQLWIRSTRRSVPDNAHTTLRKCVQRRRAARLGLVVHPCLPSHPDISLLPRFYSESITRLWLGTIFVVETGAGCRRIAGAVSI
jgi:hypothetical protein